MFRSARELFRDFFRYSRGGDPTPEALEAQVQFLTEREELSCEEWVAEVRRSVNVRSEVAAFTYTFFERFNIPIGKVRCGDRLKDDLHFKGTLQDDWDEELVDEFRRHFRRHLWKWPRLVTMEDLLLFLDQRAQGG